MSWRPTCFLWEHSGNDRDHKMCQPYFCPAEYTTKSKHKANQKTYRTLKRKLKKKQKGEKKSGLSIDDWRWHIFWSWSLLLSAHCFTHLFTAAWNNNRCTACSQFPTVPLINKNRTITAAFGLSSPLIFSPLENHPFLCKKKTLTAPQMRSESKHDSKAAFWGNFSFKCESDEPN